MCNRLHEVLGGHVNVGVSNIYTRTICSFPKYYLGLVKNETGNFFTV